MSESTDLTTGSTAEVPPASGAPAAPPVRGPGAGPVTPEAAEAALAATGPGLPFLIGVRHHAPSLAAALPALLDAAAPDVLLVELPAEFQPWLGWLAHEETEAPVALAAVPADRPGAGSAGERGPAFYPFADFSPELVALRWAARNGVPAVACDLPLADRAWAAGGPDTPAHPLPGRRLRPRAGGGARAVRRAPVPAHGPGRRRPLGPAGGGLRTRFDTRGAPPRRPAHRLGAAPRGRGAGRGGAHGPGTRGMYARPCRRGPGERAAARRGGGSLPHPGAAAVHRGGRRGPAPDAADESAATPEPDADARASGGAGARACTVSLVPYTYPLLDSRSGYPAGIRDPEWQHTVLDAAGDPDALHEAVIRTAVRVCAALREQGHPYGPADGREVVRVAGDLARLRDLPAPGRGELLEAVQTVLGRGETYGTGRAVARALEQVLVGTRTGRPTPAAPRSGLGPAIEAETAALSLPGPDDAHEKTPRDLRLDPARSTLDQRRELLLRRLTVCGIPYAQEQG
ncbi:hypothetical protein Smic_79870 [Streptomyces microflavus]|uniref:Uncharacterized protein n=1 Tax=Streptomyces microflavus TaxID=1919 RepID=A0A7J0D3X3_STRMI|nr:hypothetical protein Smic_79870 [Streptomyces microflavus]